MSKFEIKLCPVCRVPFTGDVNTEGIEKSSVERSNNIMSVKAVDYASRKKATKPILSASFAVIFYAIAFTILYNSCHSMPERVFMIVFGLLVTLSSVCAADFVTSLLRYNTAIYMVIAAAVVSVELTPLPYVWVYSSIFLHPLGYRGYIAERWIINAALFAVIMLLTAGINFLKRRYRIKISVEKNDRKSSGEPPLEKGRLALLYLYIQERPIN